MNTTRTTRLEKEEEQEDEEEEDEQEDEERIREVARKIANMQQQALSTLLMLRSEQFTTSTISMKQRCTEHDTPFMLLVTAVYRLGLITTPRLETVRQILLYHSHHMQEFPRIEAMQRAVESQLGPYH